MGFIDQTDETSEFSYFSYVREVAAEAVDKDHNWGLQDRDDDDLDIDDIWDEIHEFVNESIDGCSWIIYQGSRVMDHTDNYEAYEDIGTSHWGKLAETSGLQAIVNECAYWAMQADVLDAVRDIETERNATTKEPIASS